MVSAAAHARLRLRAAARELEEIAVLLEDRGYVAIPHELQKESARLLDILEALGQLNVDGAEPRQPSGS